MNDQQPRLYRWISIMNHAAFIHLKKPSINLWVIASTIISIIATWCPSSEVSWLAIPMKVPCQSCQSCHSCHSCLLYPQYIWEVSSSSWLPPVTIHLFDWDFPICEPPLGIPHHQLEPPLDHPQKFSEPGTSSLCQWAKASRADVSPGGGMVLQILMAFQFVTESYTGWWLGHPSEKYESQLGWLFPMYGKMPKMFQTTNQL